MSENIDPGEIWSAIKNRKGKIKEGNTYDLGFGPEKISAIASVDDIIWIQTHERDYYYTAEGIFKKSRKHNFTMLVVDDDQDYREILITIMESEFNCTVYESICGKDALNLLNSREIDIILTDYTMPNGDGKWLINEVRRKGVEIPIIIYSGSLEEDDCNGAHLVHKPLDMKILIEVVDGMV